MTTHDKENKTKVELLQNRTFRFVILHYVTNNNIDMYNLVINCVWKQCRFTGPQGNLWIWDMICVVWAPTDSTFNINVIEKYTSATADCIIAFAFHKLYEIKSCYIIHAKTIIRIDCII